MTRRWLILEVIFLLIIAPSLSFADPISIGTMVSGMVMAATEGSVVAAAIAGWAAAIGMAIGPSFLIGKISSAINGKPVDPGRTISVRSATAPRRVIYGQCRVAGIPTFIHLSGHQIGGFFAILAWSDNSFLTIVYTLCGHEIYSLDQTYLDGNQVTWSGTGPDGVLAYWSQEGGSTPVNYNRQVWQNLKLGKPCEPAFPGLVAECGDSLPDGYHGDGSHLWTSAHRQDGCASVAMMYQWNQQVFPGGPPSAVFDLKGKKLYDPRTGTVAYSKNAVLAIYDYLINKEYGLGCDSTEINTASFIAGANICDETINLKGGGTEKRYECNGMFAVDANPIDILKSLQQSIAGYISYSQGQFYVIPGVWNGPTVYLNDDDLRAPLTIQPLRRKRDLCNAVRGTFYASARKWQQADFPPIVHPTHLCEDSGYPNAVQKGAWATSTAYIVDDCVFDSTARNMRGNWVTATSYSINDYVLGISPYLVGHIFVCSAGHTSSSTNQPGTTVGGQNWASYWVDVTESYSEFRGGVYICTQAHTSGTTTQPGLGANWASYWIEAKEYVWRDLQLNFTTSNAMAQRIAKIELERNRQQLTATFKCKLNALQLQPGDLFYYSHPRYSWTNKTFQVLQCDLVCDNTDTGPVPGIDIYAQETSAAVYTWDPDTEEQALSDPPEPVLPPTEVPSAHPVAYGPGFTFTRNTTSIDFSWDYTGDNAIVLLDTGTQYTPIGTVSVGSLTAGTDYDFYPYYNLNCGTYAVISISRTSNVVSVTVHANLSSVTIGSKVVVADVLNSSFNGTFSVTEIETSLDGNGNIVATVIKWNQSGLTQISGNGTVSIDGFSCYMSDGLGTLKWAEDHGATAAVKRSRMAEWQSLSHIPLATSLVTITTTTSGSSGGGGGGDGGGCLHEGMLVREKMRGPIPCDKVMVGDFLESAEGWVKVMAVCRKDHDLWCSFQFSNGAELTVTTSHPFTLADGSMKRAAHLSLEDQLFTPTGITSPVRIEFKKEPGTKIPITVDGRHTFYASSDGNNWVLTHNPMNVS